MLKRNSAARRSTSRACARDMLGGNGIVDEFGVVRPSGES
jgi:hypothetical protein